ncbi:MAG TPA: PQQ-binding-like beta-propeller repeat protein [Phycisphaerae bacterium]|nr:PQQ-binding-like beta-propeller repeat protein [Phycisphaerae bacterium]
MQHVLAALRLADGRELWRLSSRDLEYVFGDDIVLGQNAVFLAGKRKLTALDCKTGRVLWQWQPEGANSFFSSSLVADERHLYALLRRRQVVCLRRRDGHLVWMSQPGSPMGGLVAVQGDHLVASTANPPGLAMLDTQTGKLSWRTTVPGVRSGLRIRQPYIVEHLTISGRTVLASVVVGEAKLSIDEATNKSYLCALDLRSGKLLWKASLPPRPGRGIASDGRRVYVGCQPLLGPLHRRRAPCEVWCFDRRAGRVLWKQRLKEPAVRPPALPAILPVVVSGRTILVAATFGRFAGLSTDTGKLLWQVRLVARWGIIDHVLVAGGYVIVIHGPEVVAFKPARSGKTGAATPPEDTVKSRRRRAKTERREDAE